MSNIHIPSKENLRIERSNSSFVSLNNYKIYEATVVDVIKPNNTVKVIVPSVGNTAVMCEMLSNSVSGFLGFNFNYMPPRGSTVLMFPISKTNGYIIGCLQKNSNDNASNRINQKYSGETSLDSECINFFSDQASERHGSLVDRLKLQVNNSAQPFADLMEGEVDISNQLGVGLMLLRHLSKLSAGDLATVECSLMDDMVRIISGTFKHISAFGDYKIYNDNGKLNVIWEGTSNANESFNGNLKIDEFSIPDPTKEHRFIDTARNRFASYVGYLGDFINVFVTDPITILENGNKKASGRFRAHVNTDGAMLVQSVSDIVFEKVTRIPVPVRKKLEHEKVEDEKFLEVKHWVDDAKEGTLDTFYRLRDYAKWFSNYYSMVRFRENTEEWNVASEAETEEPSINSDSAYKVKGEESYFTGYATIRMTFSGQILIMDSYNNSIEMNQKGLTLNSSSDIRIVSSGDTSIVTGGKFNVLSNGEINLSTTDNDVQVFAKGDIKHISSGGSIILQSDTTEKEDGIVLSAKKSILLVSTLGKIRQKAIDIINQVFNLFSVNNKFNYTSTNNRIDVLTNETRFTDIFGVNVTGILKNNITVIRDQTVAHDGHVQFSPIIKRPAPQNIDTHENPNVLLNQQNREIEWDNPVGQQGLISDDFEDKTFNTIVSERGYIWPGPKTITEDRTIKNIELDRPATDDNSIVTANIKLVKPGITIKKLKR